MTGTTDPEVKAPVGAVLQNVSVHFAWEKPSGRGCELTIDLDDGRELWVIRTGIEGPDEELAKWQERMGRAITSAEHVTSWPLEAGGVQHTFAVRLDDGTEFEADIVDAPKRREQHEPETEWVFEGTPGTEMGETRRREG